VEKEVLIGIFTIGGATVSGFFTFMASRQNQRWERVRRDISRLCDQVAAYHRLEELYKEQVAQLKVDQATAQTVQREMRSSVEDEISVRPSMTALEARKLKEKWG
jgi:hypothetical protein